jgi:hypothetical protein
MIGVKIYELPESIDALFDRFLEMGIDAAIASERVLENDKFRKLAERHGIRLWLLAPIFHDEAALKRAPSLLATTHTGAAAEHDWVRFVCPSREEFRAEKLAWLERSVRELSPDGVSLDFIRHFVFWESVHPGTAPHTLPRTCFDGSCLAAFERHTGSRLPSHAAQAAALHIETHQRAAWNAFRRDLITDFVARAVERVSALRPDVFVNAHLVPWRPDDFGGALDVVAGQDISELSRLVDGLSPMTYAHMSYRDAAWIASVTQSVALARVVDRARPLPLVLPSIQVSEWYRSEPVSVDTFRAELEAALRPPSDGVFFWSWPALANSPQKQAVVAEVLAAKATGPGKGSH